MVKWQDFLEKEHFDINDMITWSEVQAVKCGKQDHKIIYQRFSRLLRKLKEDRRKIFDERIIEPEPEMPKPPRMQRFQHKIKNMINFESYKDLLGKQK